MPRRTNFHFQIDPALSESHKEELMAKGGEQKRTGADEAGKRRSGRPPLPEGEKKRRKNAHDRESRATKKFEREILEAFARQPENIDWYNAFNEDYRNKYGESSKKDGTNESFDAGMLTGSSNVASNNEGELQSSSICTTPLTVGAMNSTGTGVRIGTPSEPPIWGREEELAEVEKGKMPITGDNCTPLLFPIGGSQSSKLMASASQTARQSAFAGNSNWKVAQDAPKQHDTYVAKCPSSHGLDQILLHQLSEMQKHQMSEMQKQLQCIVDNINPMIQMSVAAALAQLGFFPQTNAPTVFRAEPHHDPLSMRGTNAAAVSSGGPTTQSSPHNGEVKLKQYKAFCGEPGIITEFKAFSEKYRASTEFQLKEYEDFCKEPRIAERFKTFMEKIEREYEEQSKMLDEVLMDGIDLNPLLNSPGQEMWTAYWMESLNVDLGTINPTATGGEPHHDPLGMQGETTAVAGSASGPTTQSSPHNEKF